MGAKPKTLSEVEEAVNRVAVEYAKTHYSLPDTAIRVILWPTDKWSATVERGPTAIIRIGKLPSDPDFVHILKRAIRHVVKNHLWESMEIDRVIDILNRDVAIKKVLRERYNFLPERVPHALKDEEVVVRRFSRIEVVHRKTGQREVVEYEMGHGNIFGMTEVAKARLARRVLEQKLADEMANPHELPNDDPNWIAKTA